MNLFYAGVAGYNLAFGLVWLMEGATLMTVFTLGMAVICGALARHAQRRAGDRHAPPKPGPPAGSSAM